MLVWKPLGTASPRRKSKVYLGCSKRWTRCSLQFLWLRKVPGFNDPRCRCRNDNQTVRHILQDYPLYHDLRSTTWAEERRKEPGGGYWVEENAVTPAFRSESGAVHVENRSFWAIWRPKRRTHEALARYWDKKSRIKPPYRVEDGAILPESLHHKITYSKTHAGPDDPCESCADSAATVNVHRLAAYWPPWLTE